MINVEKLEEIAELSAKRNQLHASLTAAEKRVLEKAWTRKQLGLSPLNDPDGIRPKKKKKTPAGKRDSRGVPFSAKTPAKK